MFSRCIGVVFVLIGLIGHVVQSETPASRVLTMNVFADANCTVPHTAPFLDIDGQAYNASKFQCQPPAGKTVEAGYYTSIAIDCIDDDIQSQVIVWYYNNTIGTYDSDPFTQCPYRETISHALIYPQQVVLRTSPPHADNACVQGTYQLNNSEIQIPVSGRFTCKSAGTNSASSSHWSPMSHISMVIVVAALLLVSLNN